jgi:diacylglycerol O-acyltransferase-1
MFKLIAILLADPLSFLSRFMQEHAGPRWGNIVVWASLILGQLLCIMMYYHDYVVTHFGQELLETFRHAYNSRYTAHISKP